MSSPVIMDNLLTSLPSSLSGSILGQWLKLNSLVLLDSAFCNHVKRKGFLDILRSNECVINGWLDVDKKYLLHWIECRDVKMSKIISRPMDYPVGIQFVMTKYLSRNERHVRSATLAINSSLLIDCKHLSHLSCSLSTHNCTLLTNNNSHLEELYVHGLDDTFCSLLTTLALPKLKQLTIHTGQESGKISRHKCLLDIVLATESLQELNIIGDSVKMDQATWLAVATHCPQLRALQCRFLNIGDEHMLQFVQLCPLLASLEIERNSTITDAGLLTIVQQLPQLRKLGVRYCPQLTRGGLFDVLKACGGTLEELGVCMRGVTRDRVHELFDICPKLDACKCYPYFGK